MILGNRIQKSIIFHNIYIIDKIFSHKIQVPNTSTNTSTQKCKIKILVPSDLLSPEDFCQNVTC